MDKQIYCFCLKCKIYERYICNVILKIARKGDFNVQKKTKNMLIVWKLILRTSMITFFLSFIPIGYQLARGSKTIIVFAIQHPLMSIFVVSLTIILFFTFIYICVSVIKRIFITNTTTQHPFVWVIQAIQTAIHIIGIVLNLNLYLKKGTSSSYIFKNDLIAMKEVYPLEIKMQWLMHIKTNLIKNITPQSWDRLIESLDMSQINSYQELIDALLLKFRQDNIKSIIEITEGLPWNFNFNIVNKLNSAIQLMWLNPYFTTIVVFSISALSYWYFSYIQMMLSQIAQGFHMVSALAVNHLKLSQAALTLSEGVKHLNFLTSNTNQIQREMLLDMSQKFTLLFGEVQQLKGSMVLQQDLLILLEAIKELEQSRFLL